MTRWVIASPSPPCSSKGRNASSAATPTKRSKWWASSATGPRRTHRIAPNRGRPTHTDRSRPGPARAHYLAGKSICDRDRATSACPNRAMMYNLISNASAAPQATRSYAAAQEGLTNVQKHAHASAAWIQLELIHGDAPSVRLTIHDNGVVSTQRRAMRMMTSPSRTVLGLAGLGRTRRRKSWHNAPRKPALMEAAP